MVVEELDRDLFDTLLEVRALPEEAARSIFVQAVRGMAHLHRLEVCHRDLKLENLCAPRVSHPFARASYRQRPRPVAQAIALRLRPVVSMTRRRLSCAARVFGATSQDASGRHAQDY